MCGGQLLILGVFVILFPPYFQDRVSHWAWIYFLFQLTDWPMDPCIYLPLILQELGFRCVSPLSAFMQALEIWILVLVLEHQVFYLLDHLPSLERSWQTILHWEHQSESSLEQGEIIATVCLLNDVPFCIAFDISPTGPLCSWSLRIHLCLMSGTFQPRQLLFFFCLCMLTSSR